MYGKIMILKRADKFFQKHGKVEIFNEKQQQPCLGMLATIQFSSPLPSSLQSKYLRLKHTKQLLHCFVLV
jgi:hypothetical protein